MHLCAPWFRLVASVAVLLTVNIPFLASGKAPEGQSSAYWLSLTPVAMGLNRPVDIAFPGDGTDRMFVVEKAGVIKIVENGEVLDPPFLDISARVLSQGWEAGLLGLAFDPQFAENGAFYVVYTSLENEWRLARYTVSLDMNRADPASEELLISFAHPGQNHYGGGIVFGPDGNLWVSTGDGGGGFDAYGNSQNLTSLLGKILRINVNGNEGYTIPADNPFVGRNDARAEIWAYGLRNPWRFSFDRLNGDLYIGDVGEQEWEEIDYLPANTGAGSNFGWPIMEGFACTPVASECDPGLYVPPVAVYGHENGCAVTGGYVYRGDSASPLYGTYVFSDYCNGTFWTIQPHDNGPWSAEIRMRTVLRASSFGQAPDGDLYVADFKGGGIYLVGVTTDAPQPQIEHVSPQQTVTGGVACTLSVFGWNFASEAQVTFDGTPRPTQVIDTTELSVVLTAADMRSAHAIAVAVNNPAAATSNVVTLPVMAANSDAGAFTSRWERTDLPVEHGDVVRTWLWGPGGMTCPLSEPYAESPGGTRVVQYFDKSRMEISNPHGDVNSLWYVTNGLLATELITGNMQVGDSAFDNRGAADINVAGDLDDPNGPTYRTFTPLLRTAPADVGELLTQRLAQDGRVWTDGDLAGYQVTAAYLDPVTQHTVASPFWQYLNSVSVVLENGQLATGPLFENPFYATGRPITEPYWAQVRVAGHAKDVLMQCFERRCLTYTPSNAPEWQVEAGNVGQHYYRWRYSSP